MANREDLDADERRACHFCRPRRDPASPDDEDDDTQECGFYYEADDIEAMTRDEVRALLLQLGMRPTKRLPRRLRRALAAAPRAESTANATTVLTSVREGLGSLLPDLPARFEVRRLVRLLYFASSFVLLLSLFEFIGLNKAIPNAPPTTQVRSNITGRTRHLTAEETRHFIQKAALRDADTPLCGTVRDCAYQVLHQRVAANRNNFFVYKDADSAFNHGIPSGLFGTIDLTKVVLDSNCVDDPASQSGCSTDTARLDTTRGTVFRFNYPALTGSDFVGLNWQEPEGFNGQPTSGSGYDLTPATDVLLDARSPDNAKVQFGVGGCVTNFYQLGPAWATIDISIADLIPPPGPSNVQCPVDLTNTHVLFTVATNASMSPNGGTVLLDNIQFTPVPARQSTDPKALSLPLGNQTFGTVLQKDVTPDQANRNLAPIYEAAATALALLRRGQPRDVAEALEIADALDYALHHDNHGDPLPSAPDGSVGLHSAYQGGDIALMGGQSSGSSAQAGDVRLAGFSVKDGSCGPGGFCLVLDGATGGNNAWAMLALEAAYLQAGDVKYLDDAETIGRWIVGTLKDPATPATNPPGYGGYFVGFSDGGAHFPITGKSTENNGDIFVAFSLVAQIESNRGNSSAATQWQSQANVAGDFVMQMFDPATGRFYAGTVTVNPPSPPNPLRGNCQTPFTQKGNDIINTCDFLDSNTFTALPMAASPHYHGLIDWRRPTQYVFDHFAQTITAGGHTYSGFDIVASPSSGPNGIAWEFTGQAVVTARFIDALYNQSTFESSADSTLNQIRQAQATAPFGDGLGLPASTLQDGDTLPPLKECLDTPFQCIPERVGLAATNWAIYADSGFNPLWFGSLSFSQLNPPLPQQLVGTTSPPSKITVTNTATAPVTFSGVTITGPNASDFSVSDDCHSLPLAAGASCTITVTFRPSAAGERTATLLVKDDALGGPHSVPLVGTGLPLDDFSLSVSPEPQSVVAGAQAIYTVRTQITSGSAQSLTLSVSCPGLSCSLDTTNISSGGSATLTVSTSVGTPPGSYAITVTATGTEVTHTAVTNLGVTPAASLSPTSLTFASQQTGTASAPQTVTLKNNSPFALSINAISIGGPFSSDFAQTNNCGPVLAAGASCLISVTFTPTGVEGRRATLFVFDSAGGSPQTADLRGTGAGACATVSGCGFPFLNQRASENQNSFYVYKDGDSGFNHGFPSGLFGTADLSKVVIDSNCVDDPLSANGCATDTKSFDAARGNVFRITFPPLGFGQFVGLNFQDPQNYDPAKTTGNGYDLRPATAVQFDVRSPDATIAQFGVGGCVSDFFQLNSSWRTVSIPLSTLKTPPGTSTICPPDVSNTHLLFTVATNDVAASAGGTVLLDNVQFTPVPARQKNDPEALSFPASTQTFGVVANQRLPIPPDQVNRNLAIISASAQTVLALLQRRQPGDTASALKIADTFHYALYHDNRGDPIPSAPQSSAGCFSGSPAQQCGLHSAYINGDIAFLNNQPAPAMGQAGDVRLAGFSSGTVLCGPSGFCLVLDGATGGDNAWAIVALVAAYEQSGDAKYLDDATAIGNWIVANLADGGGYGGYFVGYNDGGLPKQLIRGKSTVHNAQIFAAFSRLAQAEAARGNTAAALWTTRADAAAKFVLRMFDKTAGRFYAGTVNAAGAGTQAPGLCPDTSKQSGNDVVNSCDSLDSDAVATLALASRFPAALDWTRPVQYALDHFPQTATAGGEAFSGFDLVPPQGAGRVGVAWEFTGQMIQAMNVVAGLGATQFVSPTNTYLSQLRHAQTAAPFGDGQGIVGSTLQDGDTLPPYTQCMKTPFQCIPERVELASTASGVFADLKVNPLQSAPVTSVFQFDSSVYSVEEACTAVTVHILRTGLTSLPASVDISSQDGTAKQKGDYTIVVGRLQFAPGETDKTFQVLISDDNYTEGAETATLLLQNPTNGVLGDPSTATLQIADNTPESSGNPIDDSATFVGQHYHDFLYRQADQSGQDFWTNDIESCGTDAACRQRHRANVSSAFFLSIEFKETGYFVIRAHKAAFGNAKTTPRYIPFLKDQREVGDGVVVGQGNWQQQLEANKQNYLLDFVSRPEYVAQFPQGMAASDYVSKLFSNAGATPSSAETSDAVSKYGSGDTAGRAAALRSVIESGSVFNAEYNPAFVLMQYFGYLRRDPDAAPDTDFSGYDFWLAKLNNFSRPGEDMRDDAQAFTRVQKAEMVRAFIESTEYRQRFGGAPGGN
jgi:Calx-beta domain